MGDMTQTQILGGFSKLRKMVRKNCSEEEIISYMNDLRDKIISNRNKHITMLQAPKEACIERSKRFLEVLRSEGNSHRLSISPKTGRVTLKIASKIFDSYPSPGSIEVYEDLIYIADKIKNEYEFENSYSRRGRIYWGGDSVGYRCVLTTDNKKYQDDVIPEKTFYGVNNV